MGSEEGERGRDAEGLCFVLGLQLRWGDPGIPPVTASHSVQWGALPFPPIAEGCHEVQVEPSVQKHLWILNAV